MQAPTPSQPPRNPRCVSRLAYCHPFQRGAVDLLMLPQLDFCLLLACSTPTRGRRNVILCQYNAPPHSILVIQLKHGTICTWRLHFGANAGGLDDWAFVFNASRPERPVQCLPAYKNLLFSNQPFVRILHFTLNFLSFLSQHLKFWLDQGL